jgi:hypothetical protein
MFKQTFGIDCIGCGTQRALYFLIHGDFVEAFKMFPAIYTTLLLGISILLFVFDRKRNYQKIVISLAIINALIMIIAYVYKMKFIY